MGSHKRKHRSRSGHRDKKHKSSRCDRSRERSRDSRESSHQSSRSSRHDNGPSRSQSRNPSPPGVDRTLAKILETLAQQEKRQNAFEVMLHDALMTRDVQSGRRIKDGTAF